MRHLGADESGYYHQHQQHGAALARGVDGALDSLRRQIRGGLPRPVLRARIDRSEFLAIPIRTVLAWLPQGADLLAAAWVSTESWVAPSAADYSVLRLWAHEDHIPIGKGQTAPAPSSGSRLIGELDCRALQAYQPRLLRLSGAAGRTARTDGPRVRPGGVLTAEPFAQGSGAWPTGFLIVDYREVGAPAVRPTAGLQLAAYGS